MPSSIRYWIAGCLFGAAVAVLVASAALFWGTRGAHWGTVGATHDLVVVTEALRDDSVEARAVMAADAAFLRIYGPLLLLGVPLAGLALLRGVGAAALLVLPPLCAIVADATENETYAALLAGTGQWDYDPSLFRLLVVAKIALFAVCILALLAPTIAYSKLRGQRAYRLRE